MSTSAPPATAYRALTEGCALVDRSERGKLALTGPDARTLLQGQLTNDVEQLAASEGCYAALLDHKGKMQADVRVLVAEEVVWLDTERVALQALFTTLRRAKLGAAAELHKRTLERGLLSLVGPSSRDVAARAATHAELPQREHAHALTTIADVPTRLVVTDTGIDAICDAEQVDVVRAALLHAGATPAEPDDAEVLRVERGRPRYGIDLDTTTMPQEAGLNERAVSFTKGCYVGQETVARLYYRGKPNRRLRALKLSAPAQHGDDLRLGDKQVGTIGTAVVSPVHGPIALAIVRREAEPGTTLAVGDHGATAEVVEIDQVSGTAFAGPVAGA